MTHVHESILHCKCARVAMKPQLTKSTILIDLIKVLLKSGLRFKKRDFLNLRDLYTCSL